MLETKKKSNTYKYYNCFRESSDHGEKYSLQYLVHLKKILSGFLAHEFQD